MPKIIYIIAGLGIVLIVIFLVFFGFGDSDTDISAPGRKPVVLEDQAFSNAVVSATTDGAIKGDDVHRAIKITVSQDSRVLTVYQGYQGTVLESYSFDNNSEAFKQFLAAIRIAGFLQVRKTNITSADGQCPLGLRYIFASSGINNVPNNLWTTSCSYNIGTFGGDASLINKLFKNQITGYSELVSGVKLY